MVESTADDHFTLHSSVSCFSITLTYSYTPTTTPRGLRNTIFGNYRQSPRGAASRNRSPQSRDCKMCIIPISAVGPLSNRGRLLRAIMHQASSHVHDAPHMGREFPISRPGLPRLSARSPISAPTRGVWHTNHGRSLTPCPAPPASIGTAARHTHWPRRKNLVIQPGVRAWCSSLVTEPGEPFASGARLAALARVGCMRIRAGARSPSTARLAPLIARRGQRCRRRRRALLERGLGLCCLLVQGRACPRALAARGLGCRRWLCRRWLCRR